MNGNDWFRHDYDAHSDIKQKRLLKAKGLSALGLYWYLVELLYQNNGRMTDKEIRLEAELVDGIEYLDSLAEYELFSFDNGIWSCKRISDELVFREEVRQKKIEAGRMGGLAKSSNAKQMPSTCQADAKKNLADAKQSLAKSSTFTFTNTNIEKEVDKSNDLSPKKKNFTKPTVDEVRAYCKERGNNIDAQAFIDFYESKGWMIGKNHMKDWRAAVRTWERMDEKPRSGGGSYGNNKTFRPKDITGRYDDLESEVIEI